MITHLTVLPPLSDWARGVAGRAIPVTKVLLGIAPPWGTGTVCVFQPWSVRVLFGVAGQQNLGSGLLVGEGPQSGRASRTGRQGSGGGGASGPRVELRVRVHET